MRVGAGVAAKVHIRMATPEAAKQLAATAQAQSQQAAAMFDRLDVVAEGDIMTVTIELSLEKLRSLVSMMMMMAGAQSSPPSPSPSP